MKKIIITLECTDDQFNSDFSDVDAFKNDLESAVGTRITAYNVEVINVAD